MMDDLDPTVTEPIKAYGEKQYARGLKDGKAQAEGDAEVKGVLIAIEFLEEFVGVAITELRKRYGIEDPNANQPIQPEPIEQESAAQPPVDVVPPVVHDQPVVELTVTDVVKAPEPPAPTVVEPTASLPMEVPAPAESSVPNAMQPAGDENDSTTATEGATETVVGAADSDPLTVLSFTERLSHSRLHAHFKTIGELCAVPSEEVLINYHGIGKTIVNDTVLALEKVGRWLGDVR